MLHRMAIDGAVIEYVMSIAVVLEGERAQSRCKELASDHCRIAPETFPEVYAFACE